MKKFIALTLGIVMTLSLAACGGQSSSTESGNAQSGTEAQTTATESAAGDSTEAQGSASEKIQMFQMKPQEATAERRRR